MRSLWHHTKRVSSHVGKKTGHFLFPYIWHYYTDTYKGKFHHLIVDSVLSMIMLTLVAINVALLGWLYVFFTPPQFEATLSAPQVVISGAELPLLVEYENIGKGIGNVTMRLVAPNGYTPSENTEFEFPSLHQAETGSFTIPGHFIGNIGEQYRFILLYDYDYYGEHYQHFAVVEVSVSGSSLEIVPTVPDKILNNETVTWTVEYTNSSDVPRTDVCITLDIPDSFVQEFSSHEIAEDGTVHIDTIEPRSSGTIELRGIFSNAVGEGRQVIKIRVYELCGSNKYTQVNIEAPINVLTPRLLLATSGTAAVDVGSSYRYTQSYTNTGDAPLRNVTIVARLANFSGKYSTLSAAEGSVFGDTITWVDPEILPGETHTRNFSVTIDPSLRQKNAEMSYTVSARAQIDDLGIETYTGSVGQAIKFNSTLNFSVVQLYSSKTGEQFGYGPYPLEADNITALRVFWEIQDFTNDLTNLTIQTTLPSQVDWTGHTAVTEGSAMTYDPSTRTVTWHTGHVTSFDHPQGASFELRVRPNSLQIGQHINVTNSTAFSARDEFTGAVLSRTVGALRTTDPIVQGSD